MGVCAAALWSKGSFAGSTVDVAAAGGGSTCAGTDCSDDPETLGSIVCASDGMISVGLTGVTGMLGNKALSLALPIVNRDFEVGLEAE